MVNSPSKRRLLIVNADDFGMTLPISRGILECCERGIVRAATAMANAPDFAASMELLAASGVALDVGLHATLTWGRPLSDPADIPSLVGRDGRFHGRTRLLLKALLGYVSEEEVFRELRLQAERLREHLPAISHLDGHHHVHVFPVICKAAERVARDFGIPYVRAPREGSWSPRSWAPGARLGMALLPASSPAAWRARGFATSDHFGGYALGAGPRLAERWRATLARLPEGMTEIMVHPGYASENEDRYSACREEEIAALTNLALRKSIDAAGIVLRSAVVLTA